MVKTEPCSSSDPDIIVISDDDSDISDISKTVVCSTDPVLSASVNELLSNLPSDTISEHKDSDVKPDVKPGLLLQGHSAQHIFDMKKPYVKYVSKKSSKKLSSSFSDYPSTIYISSKGQF